LKNNFKFVFNIFIFQNLKNNFKFFKIENLKMIRTLSVLSLISFAISGTTFCAYTNVHGCVCDTVVEGYEFRWSDGYMGSFTYTQTPGQSPLIGSVSLQDTSFNDDNGVEPLMKTTMAFNGFCFIGRCVTSGGEGFQWNENLILFSINSSAACLGK
jgi:hypothetical protein